MLIDTHCHLDASEFDADRDQVVARARAAGVSSIVIPAVSRGNFQAVRDLAHCVEGGAYALGIHPMATPDATLDDLAVLEAAVEAALDDPRFVAIGEIGLDFFVPALCEPAARAHQTRLYEAQLDLAQRHGLPVLLHVRCSQDEVLKPLRQRPAIAGIAHAFNGSFQQAEQYIARGFALGFGGAMTFERALRIRRLASGLPIDALVLETDAPDIPPAWLGRPAGPAAARRNEPGEIAGIARVLAELRGAAVDEVVAACHHNARRVLPRLDAYLQGESQ